MPGPMDHLMLSSETIHVWQDVLDRTPAEVASFLTILSSDERGRAQRLRRTEDRVQFIVGRGLLREVLARYVGGAAASLRFVYNAFGKPALNPPAVEFNVSHAANRLLIAVAKQPVGIDLEQIREVDYRGLAQTALPAEAQAELARAVPGKMADVFFGLWTRHEACVKAVGSGFGVGFSTIPAWDLDVGPGFRAAIATSKPGTRVQWMGGIA